LQLSTATRAGGFGQCGEREGWKRKQQDAETGGDGPTTEREKNQQQQRQWNWCRVGYKLCAHAV
jgi:hypothetical protein